MKIKKLLLSFFCILALSACSDSDKEDDNGGDNGNGDIYHTYRAEVEFEGAKDSYFIQVGIASFKTVEDKQVKDLGEIKINGTLADQKLYTTKGDLSLKHDVLGQTNGMHNYALGNKQTFETADKSVMLQVVITMDASSPAASCVVKTRIYKDNKLIDESRGEVKGETRSYFYSKEYYDENIFD